MKTTYKHIHFQQVHSDDSWDCLNNKSGDFLGRVEYYKPWRKKVFSPDGDAIFDEGCLKDIIDFLNQ